MIEIENILRERKLRVTPVRQAVIEFFHQRNVALSHLDLERAFPDYDRITLYRTLKSFEEAGLLHSFVDEKGMQRFALCESSCKHHVHQDEHLHFHCSKCEQYFCLPHVLLQIPTLPHGFKLSSLNLQATGFCPNCQN